MDELSILKFICSNSDLKFGFSNADLYKAQEYYFKNENPKIDFDPLQWLCENAIFFFEKCKIVYSSVNDKTPISAFYGKECIFHNNIMKVNALSVICKFHIEYEFYNSGESFPDGIYHAMYHERINKFKEMYDLQLTRNKLEDYTKLFYILYGFWNKLTLSPINGLMYIASNVDLIEKHATNTEAALTDCFNDKMKLLTFCPRTYIASNFEKLNFLIDNVLKIEDDRIAKHYIRNGFSEKLPTNTFNKWIYLANNHKRIDKILPKNKKGKVIWDIHSLTSEKVATDFIKRRGKQKKNVFNEVEFVKSFIDNEYVNSNKKLTIENAAEYFVTYYVLSKDVRYKISLFSKIVDFVTGRTTDSIKQVPISTTRFIIETRCI